MYDQLRSEHDSMKRSAIQPAGNFYPRNGPDLFSNPANMLDNRDNIRKGKLFPPFINNFHRECKLVPIVTREEAELRWGQPISAKPLETR